MFLSGSYGKLQDMESSIDISSNSVVFTKFPWMGHVVSLNLITNTGLGRLLQKMAADGSKLRSIKPVYSHGKQTAAQSKVSSHYSKCYFPFICKDTLLVKQIIWQSKGKLFVD